MQRVLTAHSILIRGNVCAGHPPRCNHFSIFLLCLPGIWAIVVERRCILRRSHSFIDDVAVKLCLGEFRGFNFGHDPSEEEVSGQNSSRWGNDIGKTRDRIDRQDMSRVLQI
jgi:hypothetical protein